MTVALLTVCFGYFLFVMPHTVMNMLPYDPMKSGDNYLVIYLVIYCLYWVQYSVNFLIYAGRCDQFQKAYKYFLQAVKRSICGNSEWKTATTFLAVNQQMLPTILRSLEQCQVI